MLIPNAVQGAPASQQQPKPARTAMTGETAAASEEEAAAPGRRSADRALSSSPCPRRSSGSTATPPQVRVQLLLHAVDGTFPYLTPALLESCFPARDCPDLALGLAVRDTCVVPSSSTTKLLSRHVGAGANGTKAHAAAGTASSIAVDNKGYGFAAPAEETDALSPHNQKPIDPWIIDYPRVTVPAFDLCRQRPTEKWGGDLAVTDGRVMVWTPHGRLPLTPEDYGRVARGLDSPSIVPLYDVVPLSSQSKRSTTDSGIDNNNNGSAPNALKRRQAALRRCREWHQQLCLAPPASTSPSAAAHVPVIFRSVLVDPNLPSSSAAPAADDDDGSASTDDMNSAGEALEDFVLQQLREEEDEQDGEPCSRISNARAAVVLGWHVASDSRSRRRVLAAVVRHVRRPPQHRGDSKAAPFQPPRAQVCVLTTDSLLQVLDAIGSLLLKAASPESEKDSHAPREHHSIPVSLLVGIHLPQLWARNRRAFVLPLEEDAPRGRSDSEAEAESDLSPQPSKRQRAEVAEESAARAPLDGDGCVNVTPTDPPSRHPWFRDPGPLVDGCRCWACKSHSRAYVYHLACADELLGEMLLFAHNLHHLLRMFALANCALHPISPLPVPWERLEAQWRSQLAVSGSSDRTLRDD